MKLQHSKLALLAVATAVAIAACNDKDDKGSGSANTSTDGGGTGVTTTDGGTTGATSDGGTATDGGTASLDTQLGGTGSESIAIIGGGTANKLWIFDGKYHRNITSIDSDGSDGRYLPRIVGSHNWNYPDLHDTHAVATPKNFSKVYTANWFSYDENSFAIEFDPKTLKETRRVAVGKGGHHMAFSPDDKYLYVANQYGTTLSVIDVASFTKIKDIECGGMVVYPTPTMYWDGVPVNTPYMFATVTSAPPVNNTTPAPAGAPAVNGLAVVDIATNTLVKTIPIGTAIHGANLTPDGKEVWVAQPGGESSKNGVAGTGDVTVIDVATLQITRRVKIGAGGIHIIFDRSNKYAFVTGGGNLYKIDRATYGVVWSVPTEFVGAHLGVSPDNKEVWTLNHGMNATRYPYLVGGLPPTGVQVFSVDDGHLITEMVTEAVSHEIQFAPRSVLGMQASSSGGATSGQAVYQGNCQVCHGVSGGGTESGPAINTGKWLNNSGAVQAYITAGDPAHGMPAYGGLLSATDLKAVSDYVATLKP